MLIVAPGRSWYLRVYLQRHLVLLGVTVPALPGVTVPALLGVTVPALPGVTVPALPGVTVPSFHAAL